MTDQLTASKAGATRETAIDSSKIWRLAAKLRRNDLLYASRAWLTMIRTKAERDHQADAHHQFCRRLTNLPNSCITYRIELHRVMFPVPASYGHMTLAHPAVWLLLSVFLAALRTSADERSDRPSTVFWKTSNRVFRRAIRYRSHHL